MKTLVLLVEYDGSAYGGWQTQNNSLTIQDVLEKIIRKITSLPLCVVGSGRTDAGVHARGQVASIELLGSFPIPIERIAVSLNSMLPHDIRIREVNILDGSFNARFGPIARQYSYTISQEESVFIRYFTALFKYKFDMQLMQKVSEVFLGKHDFTTFSKFNRSTKSYVCDISRSEWEFNDKLLIYNVCADRFVYGMVRALVGAMIDVGRGKRTIEEITQALEEKNRDLSSPAAPAEGLVLERIFYPEHLNIFK